jgi:hypothetical protein
MATNTTKQPHRDDGAILIIVLVISLVLSVVVVSVAKYTTTALSYGRVSEARTHRVAAAQAAMDDAIERLELKRSLCGTLSGTSAQVINGQFPVLDGAQAKVTCQLVSGQLPPSDGWAIVITGQGVAAGTDTLVTEAGGQPTIEGPVYTHAYQRINLSKPTTLLKGDLWYLDATCSGGTAGDASDVHFTRSGITVAKLNFDPTTRGSYCTNQTWQNLFNQVPPTDTLAAVTATVPAAPLADGPQPGTCKVFYPGHYTLANKPVLAANNYFVSGDYYFDNIGTLNLAGTKMTMGNMSTAADFAYPLLEENDAADACHGERVADNTDGATLYIGGNTQIAAANQSGFEVSRRQHGAFYVSMQVVNSTLPVTTPVIASDPGSNKDIALNGLVWAPYSSIDFGTVSAKKDAAIRGGAVVAKFTGTISNAPGGGFLIKVPTSEASIKLLLESTAILNGSSTTVSVVADYRPTTGQLAVNSWRVVN